MCLLLNVLNVLNVRAIGCACYWMCLLINVLCLLLNVLCLLMNVPATECAECAECACYWMCLLLNVLCLLLNVLTGTILEPGSEEGYKARKACTSTSLQGLLGPCFAVPGLTRCTAEASSKVDSVSAQLLCDVGVRVLLRRDCRGLWMLTHAGSLEPYKLI